MGKTSAAEKMKAYRWILLLLLITIPLAGCSGKTAKTILKEAAPDVLMNAFSSSSAPKPTLKQVPEMEVPAKQGSAGTTAVQQNDNLDIYIHRKDDYNQEISALAASINSYLGTHANFKNEEQLIPRGQRLANDIKASRQVVAGMDTTQTARKRKLLELLDTESERVSGLLEGMQASKNGGNYQIGFQRGTKAAYRYDDLDAVFH